MVVAALLPRVHTMAGFTEAAFAALPYGVVQMPVTKGVREAPYLVKNPGRWLTTPTARIDNVANQARPNSQTSTTPLSSLPSAALLLH